MIIRLARHLTILAALAAATVMPCAASGPPDLEQIVADRAAAHGVSAGYVSSIIGCESRWDVYAVGSQGELGLAQLHPRGELLRFYARGYSDPFNARESIDYLSLRLAEGGGGAWACS